MRAAPLKTKLSLRRVKTVDPEVKELHDSLQRLVDDLNRTVADLSYRCIPIGAPIAFMAAHFPAGYDLGPKFRQMDGNVFIGKGSPLDGQTLTAPTTDLGVAGLTWWVRVFE